MAPGARTVELRAGATTALLDGVDLRDVGASGLPLLDRVYVAVRAADWSTVPGEVSNLEVRSGKADFRITFDARHVAGSLDYQWHGEIHGNRDGRITCSMDGLASASFDYCRIGFCVLHPDRLAGAAYEAETADGAAAGDLPLLIAPQLLQGGTVVPPIPAFRSLSVSDADASVIRVASADEPFEMEDQRNWTDASFKSYIPTLQPGYPFHAAAGDVFRQRVTIEVTTPRRTRRTQGPPKPASLTLSAGHGRSLPAVGLGSSPDHPGPDASQVDLLESLHPDHVRVDAWLTTTEWAGQVDATARLANRIGCPLEVALYVSADDPPSVWAAVERLGDEPVARWLVFDAPSARQASTSVPAVSLARQALDEARPGAILAAGSAVDFSRLNRGRTVYAGVDALTWSIIPTAHADDDRSVMESTTAQGITVETARSFASGRSLCVGPVVLTRRPAEADPRQATLFAAAWTVSSLADLIRAAPDSLTYFETIGPRGLMDGGRLLPVYHVFEHLAAMKGGELLDVSSSASRRVAGLAVRHGSDVTGMAANLEYREQRISLGPVGRPVGARLLGDADGPSKVEITVDGSEATISLPPHGVILFTAPASAVSPG